MGLKTVTFRAPEEKVAALDSVAAWQQRDRSFIINEAIDQYLSLQEYHLALIDEGIRAADAGEVVPHSEVLKMMESLSKKAWAKKKKSA
jgi:predicted transcriptional regulator